jgi:hypothetical protein
MCCCRSFSCYRLKPQEEQLLAAVLSRDDAALEADNPFDPALLNLDELEDSAYPTGPDQLGMGSARPSACSETLPASSGAASAQHSTGSEQALADAGPTSGVIEGGAEGPAAAQVGSEPRASGSDSSGCVSRLGSCLSGSVWDLMRPSTALKGRRLSLVEIDAQLEALQAEKELAQQLKAGQPGELGFGTALHCSPLCCTVVQEPLARDYGAVCMMPFCLRPTLWTAVLWAVDRGHRPTTVLFDGGSLCTTMSAQRWGGHLFAYICCCCMP